MRNLSIYKKAVLLTILQSYTYSFVILKKKACHYIILYIVYKYTYFMLE